jgi:hypothetical protein
MEKVQTDNVDEMFAMMTTMTVNKSAQNASSECHVYSIFSTIFQLAFARLKSLTLDVNDVL